MTYIIQDLEFEHAKKLLIVHAICPFQALKHKWTTTKVQSCLIKKEVEFKFLKQLAGELCKKFNFKFIRRLFQLLQSIKSIRAFRNFLDFCIEEQIDLEMIMSQSTGKEEIYELDQIRNLIEAKKVSNGVRDTPSCLTEEKKFSYIYQQLKNLNWSFEQLKQLVLHFKTFPNMLHFFETLQLYKVAPSAITDIETLLNGCKNFKDMMQKINKIAIDRFFQKEGKEKAIHEVINELTESNKDLGKCLRSNQELNIAKHIFQDQKDKLEWGNKQIFEWAKQVKTNQKTFEDFEAIAIIYRANFLLTGQRLTYPQILCCVTALMSEINNKKKGKLFQVATGEVKSTIICLLAIIKALRGHKVDVITSSPVLAERDVNQKAPLYRMFDLTVSSNQDKTVYVKGEKTCYKADVVYGEMSQFQFDSLRDNYSQLSTLAGRRPMTVIVDEVDSLLIDNSSTIARLSSTVPGMDYFQAVYVFIWRYLTSVIKSCIEFDNKIYFVDDEGHNMNVPDLKAYISAGKEDFVHEIVDSDIDNFLRNKLELYLDYQIGEKKHFYSQQFLRLFCYAESRIDQQCCGGS
jgi:hypothetical protein